VVATEEQNPTRDDNWSSGRITTAHITLQEERVSVKERWDLQKEMVYPVGRALGLATAED
jgi:hypothetical protein